MNVLHEPEAKPELVERNKNQRNLRYALFSAGGFTDDSKALAEIRTDVQLIDV